MNALAVKIKDIYNKLSKKRITLIASGVTVLLIVLLCISIIMQVNIQRRYSSAAAGMQEQVYQNLAKMEELFTYVDEENIDVEHKLVPQLKGYYTAAAELNTAIISNYGDSYCVLTAEEIERFEAAFSEYANAFASGLSTNLARDDMAVLLAEIQDELNSRYHPTVEPTEEPVIIKN